MPVRIFTSVDLPAPFSPIRAVHLAGMELERDIVEGADAGKGLGDAVRSGSVGMQSLGLAPACGEAADARQQASDTAASEDLREFSMFDLSKVKGSPIAASPSSPTLIVAHAAHLDRVDPAVPLTLPLTMS